MSLNDAQDLWYKFAQRSLLPESLLRVVDEHSLTGTYQVNYEYVSTLKLFHSAHTM